MNRLELNKYYDEFINKFDLYTEAKIIENRLLEDELNNIRNEYTAKIQIEMNKLHTSTKYTEFNTFAYVYEINILHTYTSKITLSEPNIKEIQEPEYFFISDNYIFLKNLTELNYSRKKEYQ